MTEQHRRDQKNDDKHSHFNYTKKESDGRTLGDAKSYPRQIFSVTIKEEIGKDINIRCDSSKTIIRCYVLLWLLIHEEVGEEIKRKNKKNYEIGRLLESPFILYMMWIMGWQYQYRYR